MKMNIIKEEGNEMTIEFETNDVTIPDLIAKQMLSNPDVEFAGVQKEHPEVGHPKLLIRTSKEKPKKALSKAIDQLADAFEEIKEAMPSKK